MLPPAAEQAASRPTEQVIPRPTEEAAPPPVERTKVMPVVEAPEPAPTGTLAPPSDPETLRFRSPKPDNLQQWGSKACGVPGP